jgi:hypothetical protein
MTVLRDVILSKPQWPILKRALAGDGEEETGDEIRAIVGEMYDLLSERQRLIHLLDRCWREIPEVASLYAKLIKGRFIEDFEIYLREKADAGLVDLKVNVSGSARAALELTSWMAMHRRRDNLPPPLTEDEARAVCQEFVAAALT